MSKKCRRCGAKHISKSKVQSTEGSGALLDVQCRFAWQAQGIADLVKTKQKRDGFVAVLKTMPGAGRLKNIWKDAFRVAGAVQETCSSKLFGGQGADFLRDVEFCSIRSSGLLR